MLIREEAEEEEQWLRGNVMNRWTNRRGADKTPGWKRTEDKDKKRRRKEEDVKEERGEEERESINLSSLSFGFSESRTQSPLNSTNTTHTLHLRRSSVYHERFSKKINVSHPARETVSFSPRKHPVMSVSFQTPTGSHRCLRPNMPPTYSYREKKI